MKTKFNKLELHEDRVVDALRTITVDDLSSDKPENKTTIRASSPMMERLWQVALSDVEKCIHEKEGRMVLSAGATFGVYTRDVAYANILGINDLFPEVAWSSIVFTREYLYDTFGYKVPKGYVLADAFENIPWEVQDVPAYDPKADIDWNRTYHSFPVATDDVCWLWAMGDMMEKSELDEDKLRWIHRYGNAYNERYYEFFVDPEDGLYRGQATFVDVGGTGYPDSWSKVDQVHAKYLSTNALYVKGFRVMAEVCTRLKLNEEARSWTDKAEILREKLRSTFLLADGSLVHVKTPDGYIDGRQHNLSIAFAILCDVVTPEEGKTAIQQYPVHDYGVPLFYPIFNGRTGYHNHTCWPFADTFFLKAKEIATGEDLTALNAALLARTCVNDGTFHEFVGCDREPRGSGSQLWTAAALIDVCRRANLIEAK